MKTSTRKVWLHASSTWPGQSLFHQVWTAVTKFTDRFGQLWPNRLAEALAIKLGGPVTLTK